MTPGAAARIQSAAGRNLQSPSNTSGFYQRAQSAASNGKGGWPSTTGNPSGGGRDNASPKK